MTQSTRRTSWRAAACVIFAVVASASPAYALDDLGVVSGDTFELPGYNDGPSGGGVWPGSSGSGGDVGPMPLPNGVPDTGGSPHGGPGGGGGSGSGDSPKVDQTRPPYLNPRERSSTKASTPFDVTNGGCAEGSAGATSNFSPASALPQTIDEPSSVLAALRKVVFQDLHELRRTIRHWAELSRHYQEAKKAGSSASSLRAIAVDLGKKTFDVAMAAAKLRDRLTDYVKRLFSTRNRPQLCDESVDDRLRHAHMGLLIFETTDDIVETLKAVPVALDVLDEYGFSGASQFLMMFAHEGEAIIKELMNFGLGFASTFAHSWADHYRVEIDKLKKLGAPKVGN